MNKPTFTQGPWKPDAWGCVVKGETLIANCRNSASEMRVKSPHEDKANARLIASAPGMHALLARIASDDLGDVQTAVELAMDARELLAKVEGET